MSFHPAHEAHFAAATDRRGRLTAGLLVLAIHALLVPLLLFGFVNRVVTVPEQVTIADLLHNTVRKPPDAPPAPRRPRMAVPDAAAPEIVIEAKAPAPPAPAPVIATSANGAITMSSGGGANAGAKTGTGGNDGAGRGGGSDYDLTDYLRRVALHIQGHLITPTRLTQAFFRHETSGTVLVHLIFRPDGTVQLANIARSSGVEAFDQAALDAVHRSDPLPPFPPEVTLDHINGVIPISFTVNAKMR